MSHSFPTRSPSDLVLPYDLLPEQRNTQLCVYVQDQIRYADRVTLVVGGRHDRAVSETEGSPDKVDKAWTFKVGLIGELGWGISPYISYSEAFQPVDRKSTRSELQSLMRISYAVFCLKKKSKKLKKKYNLNYNKKQQACTYN